jgi:tetratricopeptide (TPR) repeat protein
MEQTLKAYQLASSEIERLFDIGSNSEAITLLDRMIVEAEDPAYALFFMGEAAGYLHYDLNAQQDFLSQAIDLKPEDPFLLRSMGVCQILLRREDKSLSWFERALRRDSRDYLCYRYIGLAYSNLDYERRAIDWYKRALSLRNDDYDSLRQIGISYSKMGRDSDSIKWYEEALAVNPHDYDAMRQMGVSLAGLGRLEEAFDWLQKSHAVNSEDRETRKNLRIVTTMLQRERGFFSAFWRWWHGVSHSLVRLELRLSETFRLQREAI